MPLPVMPQLLNTHKKRTYDGIVAKGLEPSEFRWENRPSRFTENMLSPALVYVRGPYYFQFDCYEARIGGYVPVPLGVLDKCDRYDYGECGELRCAYSPGENVIEEYDLISGWQEYFSIFETWLGYLKKEIESIDPWNTIVSQAGLATAAIQEQDNQPFTSEESERIIRAINETKLYVLTSCELNGETIRVVEQKLDYLAESVQRLGKHDWIHTALGVLGSLVITCAFSAEQAKEVYRFLWHAIQPVLHLPPP